MNITLFRKISIFTLVYCCASGIIVFGQAAENPAKKVNFRYSQNPKTKTRPEAVENAQAQSPAVNDRENQTDINSRSIAKKTLEVVRRANTKTVSPTEIYKIGLGDVLFISLQNSAKDANYYTVLNDGTIDYPLAGEMLPVNGLTIEDVEDLLKEKIKLYENPQVSVKVREYASHSITVLGMVEKAGEKKIQREAVPLYVVRAEAIVQPKATRAVIRKSNATTEIVDLKDAKADEYLIFPGDIVEFGFEEAKEITQEAKFYYIGGEIITGGQKEFHQGITLSQAILASGGLRKSSIKKVVVRRKNAQGLLVPTEYNLKAIKEGQQADPLLQIGDTIEVGL